MFSFDQIDRSTKAAFYTDLKHFTHHLIEGETNVIANLANVSALLNVFLEDINWVGFYLWDESANELILGPFQGKPACIRIQKGRGVCGTAIAEEKIQVVEDVFAFPGHIACDSASRSEVVIPLYKNGKLLGVLDIDSPQVARFTQEDALGLANVMDELMRGVQF